ncbi:hypothetical protein GCM10023315_29550 [Algibacter aquimarinus]|uniref:Uncharacterized protein n=2 Tax=Algibacter aquimarinus TaxID=1136748 RepID=A0ABP9HR86_9FLAO
MNQPKSKIMKKLLYLILLLPLVVFSQENERFLLNMSEITVKRGHEVQFIEGVKSWKECYLENEGEDKWNIWRRVQGEGTVYTMTSRMAKWAEMDESGDEAGKACRTLVQNFILPHVESVHYNVASSIPEISTKTPMSEDTELVNVYNFKISNSTTFREVVDALTSEMKKSKEGNRATWYAVVGGAPEVADFFVAVPFKNFAELDIERDGVWKVYADAKGKDKAAAIRDKFRASLESDWSYMYTLNKELSN